MTTQTERGLIGLCPRCGVQVEARTVNNVWPLVRCRRRFCGWTGGVPEVEEVVIR